MALLALSGAILMAACKSTSGEGPETAPVGPAVLSESTMAEAMKGPVQYRKHVEPLLRQNCLPCHDGKQMPAFVNLTSRSSAMSRGPYGYRIVPGKPDESLLVRNLSLTHAPVKSMPPVGSRMTPEEVGILRKWIQEGASWPGN